jgi:hypothetical protein
MRFIPDEQQDIWRSEDKTGANRPVVRATVQKVALTNFSYDTDALAGSNDGLHWVGTFRSILFGNPNPIREIPNILTMEWSRGVDQDVAEATLTILNTKIMPIGEAGRSDELDLPGALSPVRGDAGNPWGYAEEGWKDALVADNLVRTYEGYGCDPSAWPADDQHLTGSGVWLIDDVTISTSGQIQLKMRDVGRMFLEAIAYWSVIPLNDLPLMWSKRQTVQEDVRVIRGGTWRTPRGAASSSNNAFIGKGIIEEDGGPYVDRNGGWRGHPASHALTSNQNQYWMSTGYRYWNNLCYWQVRMSSVASAVAGVKVQSSGGPYRVFISLQDKNGRWYGKRKIPVRGPKAGFIDVDDGKGGQVVHGENQHDLSIPFVHSELVARDHWTEVVLPKTYKNVKTVRLTFRSIKDVPLPNRGFVSSEWGHMFRRAGIRQVQIATGPASKLKIAKVRKGVIRGNYSDYSDIPKWICAWAGLFWPEQSTGMDYSRTSPGGRTFIHQQAPDPSLARGRAWGDFQTAGTAGVADLTADLFDKQPLWESVSQVRDILGFIALIDETGGMIWRPANIWKLGNYVTPTDLSQRGLGRVDGPTALHTISESDVLCDFSQILSNKEMRDRIIVANPSGKPGVFKRGFTKTDLLRIAGYTDVELASQAEVESMADMIASRQLFTARRGEPVEIWGNPAIQVDDQILLVERVSSENFYHRIEQINSTLSMVDGTWTYQMSTHWLGDPVTGSLVADAPIGLPNVSILLGNWGVL